MDPSALSILKIRVPSIGSHQRNWGEPRRVPMEKKYIVRLTDEERETLRGVMKKLEGVV